MKVIEAMNEDRFERILDAGSELFDSMRSIMGQYGLSEEDAVSVAAVALGGALQVSPVPVPSTDLITMVDMAASLWTDDGTQMQPTLDTLEFEPPHRQLPAAAPASGN